MAINKVVYGSNTLIDLTSDTAVASDVAEGKQFHLADGSIGIGTATGSEDGYIWQDAEGYIHLSTEGEHQTNLQARTVEVLPEEQVISANSALWNGYCQANVSAHTADAVSNSKMTNRYITISSLEQKTYHFSGNVQITSSGGEILDTFDFESEIDIKNNTYRNIYENQNEGSYVSRLSVTLESSTTIRIQWKYGKTDTYGMLINLSIYNVSGEYDGLSSVTVGSGYNETVIKNYIERSISFKDFTFPDEITVIGDFSFAGCTQLALTSLPSSVTYIGQYAFYQCSQLALTSLPSGLTIINSYAFYNCANLALTSLPSGITRINDHGFYGCRSLTITTLPSTLTSIEYASFQLCTGITSISCNGAITTLGNYAFSGNSSTSMQLTSVSFPNMAITSTIGSVFGSTTASNACQLLEFCDIGKTAGIASGAFANCYALETLVLRRTSAICSLGNVSAFTNTPLQGYNSKTGTVYVPSALISTYQTATNWSTLYNNGTVTFVAIEGSEYELD